MKPYIPQPCHEDWNTMTQEEKGRFCDVCAKVVVVDFTTMSDAEIITYFMQRKGQKVCGHFKQDQLLQKQKIEIDIAKLPSDMPFRSFFIACCMAVFSTLFFISCRNSSDTHTKGEMIIIDSARQEIDTSVQQVEQPFTKGEMAVIDTTQQKTDVPTHQIEQPSPPVSGYVISTNIHK